MSTTKTQKETTTENLEKATFSNSTSTPIEVLEKRARALKNMKYSAIKRVQAKTLLGELFDITDAVRCVINGDDSVQFVLKLQNGEIVTCSKSANVFNNAYADYFETFGEGEAPAMVGFTFSEEGEPKNGNKPIVIKKVV